MCDGEEYVKGTCKTMCPDKEIIFREKEGLIHILEASKERQPNKLLKADRSKVVKAFVRSGAGKEGPVPQELRTPDALLLTVKYLLNEVITNEKIPWHKTYDFICDRLQAVRQDMVMQNLAKAYIISLLQPIVRFYAYSAYQLCEEDIGTFDPVLNNKQLLECLKILLKCYDYYDVLISKMVHDIVLDMQLFKNDRPYMEALYTLFNLGSPEAQRRAIELPKRWREQNIMRQAIVIANSYEANNWVRFCRVIRTLPTLLFGVVVALQLPKIRRKALITMNMAFRSKNLTYPTANLCGVLLYDRVSDLMVDCKLCNIEVDKTSVYFGRTIKLIDNNILPAKQITLMDDRLKEENLSISDLVLLGFTVI